MILTQMNFWWHFVFTGKMEDRVRVQTCVCMLRVCVLSSLTCN